MSSMKSVVAENLVKTYDKGKVKALDGLSLDVSEGTVLGVLGPNGAGKTTTVRVLSTLLTPDSGSAFVAGIDVIKHPEKVREVIGLSGQYAAVDEYLTGRENLAAIHIATHATEAELSLGSITLNSQNLSDSESGVGLINEHTRQDRSCWIRRVSACDARVGEHLACFR